MDNKNDYLRENFRRRARYEAVFIILIAAALLIVVLNINIGSVPIPVSEIVRIIFKRTGDLTQVNIIWKIRLPRILTAALLGGGRYGLGLGGGKGGDGLLPENGSSAQGESVQVTAAPEAQAPQAEASEAPGEEADDGVLTIVVKEDKLFYEGEDFEGHHNFNVKLLRILQKYVDK